MCLIFDILNTSLNSCNKALLLLNKSKIAEFEEMPSILEIKR